MKTSLKRAFSFAIVFALVFSLAGGIIEPYAQAAVFDNGDPFAAMYDSDALVNQELADINERFAELETLKIPTQNESSGIVGISGFSSIVESEDPMQAEYARQRADEEQRAYESLTPDRYIVKYREGSTADISSSLRGRVQRTERVQDKSSNVRSGNNRNQGRSGNNRNDNSSRIEVITLTERINPQTLAAELRRAGADREIEYIQPDIMLSLESLFESEDESDSDPDEETDSEDDADVESNDKSNDETDEIEEDLIDNTDETDIIPNLPVTREGSVIVAVIDTGIDPSHPALRGYMLEGWNFPAMNSITYDPSYPLASAHGTHIAGIIEETAREYGTDVKILPLQVFEDGTAYTSDILAAIQYAVDNGVSIINCSFGSTTNNPALEEAIANANEVLFVASAGNSRSNLDVQPIYPAAYRFDNVISVGSVNADGGFSYFSNYSTNLVDITALGRDVNSAIPNGEYGSMSGTSMAAARVSGAAAVLAANENAVISSDELSARILNSADRLDNLQNKANSGRRLNINNAVYGINGQRLSLNPADDFDVHGYVPTQEEQWELFAEDKVKQVAAGFYHSVALKDDGTVWAWGFNFKGELGNGTYTSSLAPMQVIGLTNVIAIATTKNSASGSSCIALKSDGTVWTWGYNDGGELGNGTFSNSLIPMQVNGLSGVKSVDMGFDHALALKTNGTVWGWGWNFSGEVGDGTINRRTSPVQTSAITGIIAIAAGESHSLAIKSGGTVWAWGSNSNGQLGDGTTINRWSPVQVKSLTGATAVSAGMSHSLAIKSGGTVWAWGANSNGQLGDGTMTGRQTPSQISGLSGVTKVSTYVDRSFYIKSDGTLWVCSIPTNVHLQNLTGIAAVASSFSHTMVLKTDGTVWAWGSNSNGQIGDGTTTYRYDPTKVQMPTTATTLKLTIIPNIQQIPLIGTVAQSTLTTTLYDKSGTITTGLIPAYSLNAAYSGVSVNATTGAVTVTSEAKPGTVILKVICNGLTTTANLTLTPPPSIATTLTLTATPNTLQIPTPSSTAQSTLTTKLYDQYGIEMTGIAPTYSLNTPSSGVTVNASSGVITVTPEAQPGTVTLKATYGALTATATLTLTSAPTKATQVSARDNYTMTLKSDGSVWAWGSNEYGQLGDDTAVSRTYPQMVNGLPKIKAISAGVTHSLALAANGEVWAWGTNDYGQLGDNTMINRTTPVKVSGLTNVKAISAGQGHSVALQEDGTVWVWGYNFDQDSDTPYNLLPVQVADLTGVIDIAAGYNHILTLTSSGDVRAWGINSNGQLGDGTRTSKTALEIVTAISNVVAISAGNCYSMAAKNDGTAFAWGLNVNGQLGDGTRTQRTTPWQVNELAGVSTISASNRHSIAIKSDGTVWAWGLNSSGQLGNDSDENSNTPVQVSNATDIMDISAGGAHSIALTPDGTVWTWGDNEYGQLGDGTTIGKSTPAVITVP